MQRIKYIGAVLDSTQAKVYFPENEFQTMLYLIARVIVHPLTAWIWLKLLGHMATCTYTVQYMRLSFRHLQLGCCVSYSLSRHCLDTVLKISS